MQAMPSGALAGLLGVSQVVYLGAMLVLGSRLLARSLRSGDGPAALLALHFLLCCTLGYALLGGGLAATQSPGAVDPIAIALLVATGQIFSGLGVLAAAAFTWRVFRREERWARWWFGALAALLLLGFLGSAFSGGYVRGAADPWYRVSYAGYVLSAVWVMVEPLRYWRVMRRRSALGLAEPLLVQRFLLWSAGSVCRFGMLVVGALSTTVQAADLDATSLSLVLISTALLGLGVAASYWLAFFPPLAYARLVDRRG